MLIKDKHGKIIKENDLLKIEYKNIKYKAIVKSKNEKLYPDRIDKKLDIDDNFPVYNEAMEIIK